MLGKCYLKYEFVSGIFSYGGGFEEGKWNESILICGILFIFIVKIIFDIINVFRRFNRRVKKEDWRKLLESFWEMSGFFELMIVKRWKRCIFDKGSEDFVSNG